MTSNADSRCHTKLDWLRKNVEPNVNANVTSGAVLHTSNSSPNIEE